MQTSPLHSRTPLTILAAVVCLALGAVGCGGGDDSDGGGGLPGGGGSPAARGPLPLNDEERCDGFEGPACMRDHAPPGTEFTQENRGAKWRVKYVGTKVERGSNPSDPANPEFLQMAVTLRYSLEANDEPVDITNEFAFFEVSAAQETDSMNECGQKPESGTIAVGSSLEVAYCFRALGPPNLIKGPLQARVEYQGSGPQGQAWLAVKDVPGPSGESGEGGVPEDAPDAPDTYNPDQNAPDAGGGQSGPYDTAP